ncbi:MAG: class III extradiol ring-cleavage dioxygenase [Steroidobacteraceae bacterium]
MQQLLPTFYVPHGGGPCFFMDDPQGNWTGMATFLRSLPASLPTQPRAIVCVSGHWETQGFATTGNGAPPLVFDYYGFPPHTYQLTYPAPGDPSLAEAIVSLLAAAGFDGHVDAERGYDHGVFVPLKVVYPDAAIPVVELSLDRSLDPALHLAMGHALKPLRERGVLLFCAGMSFHNLRAMGDPRALAPSKAFDDWLTEAVTLPPAARASRLERWSEAPAARIAHPRHEHLLPLMVAAGAADGPGKRIYHEEVLGMMISGYRFD